jgi:hypothetical protein
MALEEFIIKQVDDVYRSTRGGLADVVRGADRLGSNRKLYRNLSGRNILMSCCVSPLTASSAMISPTTLQNLNP